MRVAHGSRRAAPVWDRQVPTGRRAHTPRTTHRRASGSLTEITKRCTESSRSVSPRRVTVPGQGGRPSERQSDADRVRAHRARPAGRYEPPEPAQEFDNGDELALAFEQVRALKQELAAAANTVRALGNEVRSLRRELTAQGRRFGWLERSVETHRAARIAAEAEHDALAGEPADVGSRPCLRFGDTATGRFGWDVENRAEPVPSSFGEPFARWATKAASGCARRRAAQRAEREEDPRDRASRRRSDLWWPCHACYLSSTLGMLMV